MISATRIRLTATTTKCRSITITTSSSSGSGCKAAATRKGGKIINILPKNRFFTTTTTAEAHHRRHPLLVVSRRNWKEYELKHILPNKPTKPKVGVNAGDEKPWPRNVQIAGYVVAAIFIPYSTVWLITSNPTLRDCFGPYLPMDKLRKHFGDVEWDVQSYTEMMESSKKSDEEDLPNGYYQFPLEASYKDRKQQTIIEEFDTNEIVANLYYVKNNNQQQTTTITKEVPASTRANLTSLSELMGIGTTTTTTTSNNNNNNKISIEGNISIDFINEDEQNNVQDDTSSSSTSLSNTNNTTDGDNNTTTTTFGDDILLTVYDDSVSSSSSSSSKPKNNNDILLQTMFSYSSWHHFPNMQGQVNDDNNSSSQQQSKLTTTANVDLEISKLEYIINELSSNLKDPLCTRDIDDMTNELNQSKNKLRRLKWKRRLGW